MEFRSPLGHVIVLAQLGLKVQQLWPEKSMVTTGLEPSGTGSWVVPDKSSRPAVVKTEYEGNLDWASDRGDRY